MVLTTSEPWEVHKIGLASPTDDSGHVEPYRVIYTPVCSICLPCDRALPVSSISKSSSLECRSNSLYYHWFLVSLLAKLPGIVHLQGAEVISVVFLCCQERGLQVYISSKRVAVACRCSLLIQY